MPRSLYRSRDPGRARRVREEPTRRALSSPRCGACGKGRDAGARIIPTACWQDMHDDASRAERRTGLCNRALACVVDDCCTLTSNTPTTVRLDDERRRFVDADAEVDRLLEHETHE